MLKELLLASQLFCVQEAAYHEARSEGFAGMVYVAAVIYNRVIDDKFPDTPCAVVNQPHQFAYRDDIPDLTMHEKQARRMAYLAAYSVLSIQKGPLFGNILYYHTDDVTPNWNYAKIEAVKKYKSHQFYSDR